MEQSGNIIVVEAEDNFKRVHKSIIENKNIDCETLGIYTRIIVLGLKWKLNIKGLSAHLGVSDTRIRKSISTLEQEGYIVRTAVRGEGGKFFGWDYKILPTPIEESKRSCAGKPTSQKTDTRFDGQVGEPTTRSTDNTVNGQYNNSKPKESIDLKEDKTKNKSFNFKQALLDLGIDEDVADDWISVRKRKKASNSERAFNKIKNEIEKSGTSANECITIAADRCWIGFEADWVKNTKRNYNNQKKPVYSQNRNETLKPDMPILNEDGDLLDGTFFRGNARWYVSEIDAKPHSIPVKAPQRPDKRYEWDSVNNRWYLPTEKWEVADEIW